MRFAVLDAGFAQRVRPWPQIMQALLRRVERRTRNLNVQRAIACQPRLEVRLALLLWHLAARWGRVEPGGIRLPLPLTHQLLGRLDRRRAPVGVARPRAPGPLGPGHRPRGRVAPARPDRAAAGEPASRCRARRVRQWPARTGPSGRRVEAPWSCGGGRARVDLPLSSLLRFAACDDRDPLTQLALERALRELALRRVPRGRARPLAAVAGWWAARAPALRLRRHRGDLVAHLREHYGTIAPNPWKRPPYPTTRALGRY